MKHPGGGKFDRDAGPIYFFAGAPAWKPERRPRYSLMALNDLIANPNEYDELQLRIDQGCRVFLDSGVFNLANQHALAHGMPMDQALGLHPSELDGFAPLRAAYVDTVKRYEADLWGYVELDQGGADRKRETRAGLEAEGIVPIPVYHPINDGWDYFDELCSNYDRICLGNVVQAMPSVRRRLLSTVWERHRAYPHVWIHLLGLTPSELVGTLPFDSCDSSTFVGSLRYGAMATPFAMSALRRMSAAGPDYSYDPDGDLDHRRGAVEMAVTGTDHLSRVWAVQQTEAARLAPPLPPRESWEPKLQRASS